MLHRMTVRLYDDDALDLEILEYLTTRTPQKPGSKRNDRRSELLRAIFRAGYSSLVNGGTVSTPEHLSFQKPAKKTVEKTVKPISIPEPEPMNVPVPVTEKTPRTPISDQPSTQNMDVPSENVTTSDETPPPNLSKLEKLKWVAERQASLLTKEEQ